MIGETGAGKLPLVCRYALILFVASVPVVAWAVEVGVALTASHLLALLIIGLAGAAWFKLRHPPVVDLVTICLLAFLAVASASVLRVLAAPDFAILGESIHAKAAKQLVGLWFAAGLFLSLRYLLDSFSLGRVVLRAHFWTTVSVAALAILQYGVALWDLKSPLAAFPVHNSTLGETRILDTGVALYGFPRVSLTLVEPSRLGIYLLTGWAFWLFATGPRRSAEILSGPSGTAAGILLGSAVVLTGSRSAYVVFLFVVLGAVAFRPHRVYRIALVGASLLIAATLVGPRQTAGITASLVPPASITPSAPEEAATRQSTSRKRLPLAVAIDAALLDLGKRVNPSARHRVASLIVTLAVLRERPWLGYGYGTSEFAMVTEYPASIGPILIRPMRPTMLGAYNTVLAETGVLGAVCVAGLALAVMLGLLRSIRSGAPGVRAIAWGLAAALGSYAFAMTALAIEVYQFLLVWLLLSLSVTAARTGDPLVRRLPVGQEVPEEQPVHLQHAP